jgi:hypothetical protein
VFDHEEQVIRRLVAFLEGTDFAGVIFCNLSLDGTFQLSDVHLAASKGVPDVVVSMRWSAEKNEFGASGIITSMDGRPGLGTHGSLSHFDMHNTLIAAGPDFKAGFVNQSPSGNIDVAPTVLSILGIKPPTGLDGRVLVEALADSGQEPPKAVESTLEGHCDLGFLAWRQYLKVVHVGNSVYFEEGNGEVQLK